MSDVNPVRLTTSGPPETVLPPTPVELLHALKQAAGSVSELATVAARNPRSSRAWAELADATSDPVSKYAFYRVGYHRGLDALRANGWRGSGYVRWTHEGNRGVLSCIAGLARSASAIGEDDEAERCRLFVRQLEPSVPPELT
ncbi:MAG: hypothetical protein B7C54_09025 [Acidimicrobiales bacterium mtb01]|nr:DUF3151 domain-containing protein [Actinomycetota bacterium]TEX45245.1 MAG: hypothetical protein B7C54_09025 [Acidimicrobiales bacterium mtb01]